MGRTIIAASSRLLLFLFLALTGGAEESRKWADRAGHSFSATILACDALRVTLDVKGRGKTVVPFAALSAADVEFARNWRAANPGAPLIDPACLPPWPTQAGAETVTIHPVEDDAATHSFTWESDYFRIGSDLRLPSGIVRDLAAVLEGTRAVVLAAPLGLRSGGERAEIPGAAVLGCQRLRRGGRGRRRAAAISMGAKCSSLLPNLGIKPGTNGLTAEHTKNLFVLKHEVTHQLLRPWGWTLPSLARRSGFAECVAFLALHAGALLAAKNLDAAMHDYLLKWRRGPGPPHPADHPRLQS